MRQNHIFPKTRNSYVDIGGNEFHAPFGGGLAQARKGGMLKDFADMAQSSRSDGLVFDGRRYLKGKEEETLQAGGLLEVVPSKLGWDYRQT